EYRSDNDRQHLGEVQKLQGKADNLIVDCEALPNSVEGRALIGRIKAGYESFRTSFAKIALNLIRAITQHAEARQAQDAPAALAA
ncbi:MAG: hypothetical protein P8189_29110, partial [Anaerolineae bacterium]